MTKNKVDPPISSLKKQQAILNVLFEQVKQVIEFNHFFVALYDRRTVELHFFEYSDNDNGDQKVLTSGESQPYRPAEFVPDYLFQQASSPILKQTGQEFIDWLKETKLKYRDDSQPKSWMGVPLKSKDHIIGVIIAEHFERDNLYSKRDLETLAAMADRVSSALNRIRQAERLEAINEVGQQIAAGVSLRFDTHRTLELIYEQAGDLMDTRNMYVALYNEARQELTYPLFYINKEPVKWEPQKVDLIDKTDWSPTKEVLSNQKPLRLSDFKGWYKSQGLDLPNQPSESWLGVPLVSGEKVLGVIALQNYAINGLYTQRDVEILQAMANQVAIAIANARLVENLRTVSEVSRQLTSGIELDEAQILDLIYEQASQLMDTRSMYVALYNEAKQQLTFPLAYVGGEREKKEWKPQNVDVKSESDWSATKEVVANKKGESLRIDKFVEHYVEIGWEIKEYPPPKSWLGVPLISGDRVLGVISLQNDEVNGAFSSDDEEVLEIIAGQAAVAIANATAVDGLRRAQNEIANQERALVTKSMEADLIHRINNMAGTLPGWVTLIKRTLPIKDINPKVERYLDKISRDAAVMLDEAKRLQEPQRSSTSVDLKELVGSIVAQVEMAAPLEVEIDLKSDDELPLIYAVERPLANAIYSVIQNAVKAISDRGTISIFFERKRKDNEEYVQIVVSDTGCGIEPDRKDIIFSYGDSYWPNGKTGTGYGLWRARSIIQGIGGTIELTSSVLGKGTTFTILLPVLKTDETK